MTGDNADYPPRSRVEAISKINATTIEAWVQHRLSNGKPQIIPPKETTIYDWLQTTPENKDSEQAVLREELITWLKSRGDVLAREAREQAAQLKKPLKAHAPHPRIASTRLPTSGVRER